jgi:hypothetical protein
MKTNEFEFLIEQPQLSEICPCGSKEKFGTCCGSDNLCDCKSHLIAVECCYQKTENGQLPKLVRAHRR